MTNDQIDHLANWLWKQFEYTLPVSPRYMAELIAKELDNHGSE